MDKTTKELLAEFDKAIAPTEPRTPTTKTKLATLLTKFRIEVETEAKTGIANIETNLALALADMAEALGIKDPEVLLQVLGDEAYLAVYVDPIPYQLPGPPAHHGWRLLLAKLRDTWRGRWTGEPEVEPC